MLPLIITMGTTGIILFLGWEIATWKKAGKYVALSLQVISFSLGLIAHLLVLTGPRLPRDLCEVIPGALLLALSTYLLYRSLWADLPRQTYAYRTGVPYEISRRGTYAFMRHPGLWWYALFLGGLFLVTGAQWLVWAGMVWWSADFVVILCEDLYLFPRLFANYRVYKKEVPMLIPNLRKLISKS